MEDLLRQHLQVTLQGQTLEKIRRQKLHTDARYGDTWWELYVMQIRVVHTRTYLQSRSLLKLAVVEAEYPTQRLPAHTHIRQATQLH